MDDAAPEEDFNPDRAPRDQESSSFDDKKANLGPRRDHTSGKERRKDNNDVGRTAE